MKILYTTILCLSLAVSFAQPVNDNCADAIAISEVAGLAFSNIDATTDGPFHPDSPCPGGSDIDSLYNDIWYLYTPTFSGNCFWTLCGTTDFDTKIAVYNPGSPCPPLDGDLLDCNEEGESCAQSSSEMIFTVVEGQTYLLRLAGFGEMSPGEEGSGTFTVEEFVPLVANDFCEDAIEITLGEGQVLNTVGATTDGPEHPNEGGCFGFDDIQLQSEVWFTFAPTFTGTVEWSTCDMITFDSRLAVYGPDVSCPVLEEDLYACNDDGAGCADFTSRLIFDVESGNTYLLRIGGFGGETGSGTFDLVTTQPLVRPSNDLCEDAQEVLLTEPGGFEQTDGTTINASYDQGNFEFPLCIGNTQGEFAEVWYAFNSDGNTEIELVFSGSTAGSQFYVDIWNDCGSGPVDTLLVESSCFDITESGQLFIDTIRMLDDTPADYLMRVVTWITFNLPGDFFFQLNAEMTSSNAIPESFNDIRFAPNPVVDQIMLSLDVQQSTEFHVSIFDVSGKLRGQFKNLNAPDGRSIHNLNVPGLESGLFLMTVSSEEGEYTMRFVKN